VCLFLYGLGANGKTTLLEVLRMLLGEYATHCDFSTLTDQRNDGPRNDIARLAGARLVTASEVASGARLNEPLIKSLTGGDRITARYLYAESFEFTPAFKLIMIGNHRPTVHGTDLGIWRRLLLLPCTVTIPESERDHTLLEKLKAELPGILRWAVEGCLEWQEYGLEPPAAVKIATAEYREQMDTLAPFLEANCEQGPDAVVDAGTLYSAYTAWCTEAGERAVSQRTFGGRLAERGFLAFKGSRGVRRWRGLSLQCGASGGCGPSGGFLARGGDIERNPQWRNEAPPAPHDGLLRVSA
jgi:putative DNA primase/helicase